MVTGEVTETHSGLSGVRVTSIPGSGAAMAEPALSSRIVISTGKPAAKVAEDAMIFRLTAVVTSESSLT